MAMGELWRRMTTRRYVRALEAEVSRLRAENRALLNSILGIAGVPPIPATAGNFDEGRPSSRYDGSPRADRSGRQANRSMMPGVQATAPMRRRSWQQITRALELESARRKENS